MTRIEGFLLVAGIGAAVLAIVYWKRSAPSVTPAGGAIASLLGLPDPATLPLGTRSPDGRYVVTQSRQAGSAPQWTYAPTGGIIGMGVLG